MKPTEKLKELVTNDHKQGYISEALALEIYAIIDWWESNPIHEPKGNLSGVSYSGIIKDIAYSNEEYCNELIMRSF